MTSQRKTGVQQNSDDRPTQQFKLHVKTNSIFYWKGNLVLEKTGSLWNRIECHDY